MRSLLALAVLIAAVSGCSTHQCDASSSTFDGGAVTQVNGGLVFQSVEPNGTWTEFRGNETVTFNYPSNFENPYDWNAFVSTSPTQDAGTFTSCVGQLCELTNMTPTSIQVTNASCADYYLYFIAYAHAPTIDAGADAPHD